MAKLIRIGVLGCANIAHRSMIPAIRQLDTHFDLIGIASRDGVKAASFAAEFGCKPYGSYDELVEASDVDALYIPLPTGLHKKWIDRALSAGKHVYAEKSIALCEADAREMVARARANSLVLMEGFMFQYHRQHLQVKELLASGIIGELRHFSSSFGFPPLLDGDFRYDDAIGGGVLMDAAGYPVRATHFLLGDEFEVKAATLFHHKARGTQTYGSAFLANHSGIGASLAFSFDSFYQCRYELLGQFGKLTAERAFTARQDHRPRLVLETNAGTQVIEAEQDNHFVNAMLKFHASINFASDRETLYSEILLQSKTLSAIKDLWQRNAGIK